MDKRIYIIGESKDLNSIRSFEIDLNDQKFKVSTCTPDQLYDKWNDILNIETVILLISPETNSEFYNICLGRYNQKKYTLNLFVEPTELSSKQKNAIGKNNTIFLWISKGWLVPEIVDLLISSPRFNFIEMNWTTKKSQNENNPVGETIYEEEINNSKNKKRTWIGLIIAACLIGFGIWGYAAYVESSKKAEDLRIWETWEEYLSYDIYAQMFSAVSQVLLQDNKDNFKTFIFEKYLKDRLDVSESEEWLMDQINNVVGNITFEFPTPIDLNGLMSENLLKKYIEAKESDFEKDGGINPVTKLNEAGVITFKGFQLFDNGSDNGFVYYSLRPYASDGDDLSFLMSKENGKWKIKDFFVKDGYFTEKVDNYLSLITQSILEYTGERENRDRTTPLKLKINFGKNPLQGVYKDLETGETIEMSGYEENGMIRLSSVNPDDHKNLILNKEMDNRVLKGTFEIEDDIISSAWIVSFKDINYTEEDEDLDSQPNG